MRKESTYSKNPFLVGLLMVCGYSFFIAATQPSADQADTPVIRIDDTISVYQAPAEPATIAVVNADQNRD